MIDVNENYLLVESTLMHQRDILQACKGWFKFSPTLAACIYNFLDDEVGDETIKHIARTNLQADGMVVSLIEIKDKSIKINAKYNS